MHNGRIPLNIFDGGVITAVLHQNSPGSWSSFSNAVCPDFLLMEDNARPHKIIEVSSTLVGGEIQRMAWPAYSLEPSPMEHVLNAPCRHIAQRQNPSRNIQELKLAL